MSTQRKLVSIVGALAFVAVGSSAFGQQSKDAQKCVNGVNKDTGKLAATQGKENGACVKGGIKAAPAANCVTADAKGKVGKTKTKTTADETKNCAASGAPFAYTSGTAANSAMYSSELDLLSDTYGTTNLSTVIAQDKLIGGCQSAVTAGVEKVAAAYVKAFDACKKNALKAGATDGPAIAACANTATSDPKLKVAGAITKLQGSVTSKCTGVTHATAFPGVCSAAADLGACLGARAKCQMCQGLAGADNVNADCDTADDGTVNGSCVIPEHLCTLDTSPTTDSQISIYVESIPAPLAFGMSGSIKIGGEGSQAVCAVNNINPISIPSIGVVCITPGAGCAPGRRDCTGGTANLGVDVESNSQLNNTCTGNNDCANACAVACNTPTAGFGSVGQCTGFCSAGTQAACTNDSDCLPSNGACNGPDPVASPGVCQCTCTNSNAFGAADPGDIQCNLSSHLVIESAAPCNGTDVTINVGDSCIPVTTERAVGKIINSNGGAGTVPPSPLINDATGTAISCASLDASTTTGLVGVGAVNFFGSALGDLSVGLRATCQ